jgi:hypothetical protein
MSSRIIRKWLGRLSRRFLSELPRPRGSGPAQSSPFQVEQLEDRAVPSVTTPAAALMKPTYELFDSTLRIVPAGTGSAPAGLSPAQVRTAYGFDRITFPGGVPADGTGETIAIVDAYDDPTAASDLAAFDQQFGLPVPAFVKVGINAQGAASITSFPNPDADWSVEIALDVEWTHAIAPGATILLVEANSNSYVDLLRAVDYARTYPGVDAVSMSWGGSEFAGETSFDSHFTTPAGHSGVTFFASAGDSGAPALAPSVSSHVVAVGGTSLAVDTVGDWSDESAWSGGGGGLSAYVTQPAYQNGLLIFGVGADGRRATPDVAYDADPYTGVAVLSTYGYGGWLQVGGTSAGSPQWAALVTLADQGRALAGEPALDGFTQTLPDLYKLPAGDFHDIVTGDNGYPAGPGYDLATGLGSPVVNFVVADLIGYRPVASGIAVTPAAATVSDGNQLQLSAAVVDQYGRPMADQPSFTWSLVNGMGQLSAGGLYTAPASGTGTDTVTVAATVNGVSWSATATVSYAPGLAITSISASPGVVTGTTTTVSATAVNPAGGDVFYFWWVWSAPDGAGGPLFSDPGSSTTTATFFEPGAYTLDVVAYNLSGDMTWATVNVTVVSTVTSLEVSPLVPDVPVGGRQQFSAQALDQFYNPMPATFDWSIAGGPGTVDATGLYTAPAAGSGVAYVQATTTVNGATVSGQGYAILLQPPVILSISASPSPVTAVTLSAAAYDPNGVGGLTYLWSAVAVPPGAKAPTFSADGAATTRATFSRAGTYTFQVAVTNAASLTALGTVNVTVNPVLTAVVLTPAAATVPDQVPQQFTAAAFDQFREPLPAVFAWSMVSGPGAVNGDTGLYTPPASGGGTAVVRAAATVNGVTLSRTARVALLPPPVIASVGAGPGLVTGRTTALKVVAFNPGGGSLSYVWKVLAAPAGAPLPTLSTAGSAAATATFFQAGSYTFQVTVTNQKGSATVATVSVRVNSVPTYLLVLPATATVPRGQQQQFSAQVQDQFHAVMTPQATAWSVSGLGSVSGAGLYLAPTNAKGSAVIRVKVTVNGVSLNGTASVSVV